MRGLRSTIAFAVVLVGLSAYIYFVTNKRSDTEDPASKQENVFASLAADKVDEIEVKSESGDATSLKKEAGTWRIVSPVTAVADAMEVTGILGTLSSLTVVRVIDENPADLKDYGLATPRIEVGFKSSGDTSGHKLLIGDKSPTGSDLFARRDDDKRVFLISTSGETVFNRSAFELRDKALLKIESDKVDGLEVVADGKTLQLTKAATGWSLVKPRQIKADFASVDAVLSRLQTAQMRSIVTQDPSPADLKKFGLDRPSILVTVSTGSSRATLVLGNKAPDNTYYARDASTPLVVTVDGMLGDDLKKGADEYRQKDLFELRSYNTNHIEISRDGQTIVLDMTKGTGDAPNKWRRTSPNPADIDRDKTDNFLTKLWHIRATAFVDSTANTGLDKPIATVKAKFEETKEETVTIGKSGDDYYAARPGEPGAAKIPAADFNDAMQALDAAAK